MSALWNLGFLLITIGVLVTVHEFGHFWVARRCGIRVLVFSIGFGPTLWSRQGKDGVEYRIGALPLGGFVRMLDEREGEVPPDQAAQAFNRASVGRRFATVAAGPVANFLFAILAFALMYAVGVRDMLPFVGEPPAGSAAAQAGLRKGDEVRALDGRPVTGWESLSMGLIDELGRDTDLPLRIARDGGERELMLAASALRVERPDADPLREIGVLPWFPEVPAIVGEVVPEGAGARAGLQAGDLLLSLDGQPLADWPGAVAAVRARSDKAVTLAVRRAGRELSLDLQVGSTLENGKRVGHLGVAVQRPVFPESHRTITRLGPADALIAGVHKTGETLRSVLRGVMKLVTGRLSLDTLSGPVSIAQGAGTTASLGVERFLWFLGLISVNLGLINLLPIPVLDGGHLLFFAWEMLRGRPAPERVQAWGMQLGMVLIGGLMLIALYNDFVRLS